MHEPTPEQPLFRFDAHFLRSALLRLIIEPFLIDKYQEFITPDIFDTLEEGSYNKKLATMVLKLRKEGEVNIQTLEARCDLLPDAEERHKMKKYLQGIQLDDGLWKSARTDGVFNTFLQYLKAVTFMAAQKTAKSKFESTNFESAYAALETTLSKIKAISLEQTEAADWTTAIKQMETDANRGFNNFEIGIKDFDSISGMQKQTLTMFVSTSGGGKCLGRGTKLLMADYSVRAVEDVREGEYLLGPDGLPRLVKTLSRGRENLYRVKQSHGDDYVVNESHILVLQNKRTGLIENVELKTLLDRNIFIPEEYRGVRTGAITPQYQEELPEAIKNSLPAMSVLFETAPGFDLLDPQSQEQVKNKTVPTIVFNMPVKDRIAYMKTVFKKYLGEQITRGVPMMITPHQSFADSFRALGMVSGVEIAIQKVEKLYYMGALEGRNKLFSPSAAAKYLTAYGVADNLRTTYEIDVDFEQEDGEYFGFEIDGDRRFVLADSTITHNTMMTTHMVRKAVEQGKRIYVACVEDRKATILRRVFAAVAGLDIDQIKNFSDMPSAHRKLMEAAAEKLKKHVTIEFIYNTSHTYILQRVKEQMDRDKIEGNPPYEAVLIDYIQHIGFLAPGDSLHEKLHRANSDLKNFALQNNVSAITHFQVNREGQKQLNNNNMIDMSVISGAYNAVFVADNIISINRSPEDRAKNKAILYVIKGREGCDQHKYEVPTDFAKARYNMEDCVLVNESPIR
jgi:replicative DNA helicase